MKKTNNFLLILFIMVIPFISNAQKSRYTTVTNYEYDNVQQLEAINEINNHKRRVYGYDPVGNRKWIRYEFIMPDGEFDTSSRKVECNIDSGYIYIAAQDTNYSYDLAIYNSNEDKVFDGYLNKNNRWKDTVYFSNPDMYHTVITNTWPIDSQYYNRHFYFDLNSTPVIENISDELCDGKYTTPSGRVIENSGTHYDTIRTNRGCDSIVYKIVLTKEPINRDTQRRHICHNYTVFLPDGTEVNEAGTHAITWKSHLGCDSFIRVYIFTVVERKNDTLIDTTVVGNLYTAPTGTKYTQEGRYEEYIYRKTDHTDSCLERRYIYDISFNTTGGSSSITNNIDFDIIIYPNPTNRNLFVETPSSLSISNIHIFDISGRKMKVSYLKKSNSLYEIKSENLPNGSYIIHLVSKNEEQIWQGKFEKK